MIRHPHSSERLAIGQSGELLSIPPSRKNAKKVDGGLLVPRVETVFHLELDDVALVEEIQRGLRTNGVYPVMKVLEGLAVVDRIVHPQSLADAAFRFDSGLEGVWARDAVSARCEYRVSCQTSSNRTSSVRERRLSTSS